MFVTKKVFDPVLHGKAIYLSGNDPRGRKWDKVVLVNSVEGDFLGVIDNEGENYLLRLEDFEPGFLEIEILGLTKRKKRKERKRGYSRNVEEVNRRTEEQIAEDNNAVAFILRENAGPMKLSDILKRMNELGCNHWSDRNASGFVQYAIKHGKPIKKIDHGIYEFIF